MSGFLGPRPRWVVHPLLFAAAFVLNLALSNEVTPEGILRPLIVILCAVTVLMLIGRLLLGNRWDGALLATVTVAAIVSPVPIGSVWFYMNGAFGVAPGTVLTAGLLVVIAGAIGIHVLRRRHRRLPVGRPTEALQILSVVLVLAVVGTNLVAHPPAALTTGGEADLQPLATPDIIVILLDGYPRHDVLARRIGADDERFLDGLRARGFDVARESRSNYMHTALTLASMFQMRYVDQIPALQPFIGSGEGQLGAFRLAAESGQAFSTLEGAGYDVTLSTPGWEHATFRGAADELLDSGELTDLERSLVQETWLLYLINLVTPNLFTDSLRDRIVHSFDALDRFATQPRDHPAFLFLHVPAPHLPLAVRADGTAALLPALLFEQSDRHGLQMTDREYADAWASELAYVDGRVLSGIDRLLQSDVGRNAVVVVMADHGYQFEVRQDDPEARIGNLFAARTPGAPSLLADSPTPVNLFRLIFDRYLGTHLGTLTDRYFISDWRTPLRLDEIDIPVGAGGP